MYMIYLPHLSYFHGLATHAASWYLSRLFWSTDLAKAQRVLRILLGPCRILCGVANARGGIAHGASGALGRVPNGARDAFGGVAEGVADSANCNGSGG